MPLPAARGLYDPSLERDACGLGFVADLRRPPTHDVVTKGIEILRRLTHRGAAGCDPCTGDGAGVLLQLPHELYLDRCKALDISLPGRGDYAVAMCFLSQNPTRRREQESVLESAVLHHNQRV